MWPIRKPSLFLTKNVLTEIAEECKKFGSVETGGLLIGYHENGAIVVTHTTGPGPRAVHEPTSLVMDLDYIRVKLREHEDRLPIGYEGNWHTHPKAKLIIPSADDKALMQDIVKSEDYDISRAVLLITPDRPRNVDDYNCYIFDSRWRRRYVKVRPRICANPFSVEATANHSVDDP